MSYADGLGMEQLLLRVFSLPRVEARGLSVDPDDGPRRSPRGNKGDLAMRAPRFVFGSIAVAALFACSVTAAHAVTIEFFGTRDSFNGAPPVPNPAVCGADLFLQIPSGPGDSNLGSFTHDDSHCVASGNVFNGVFNWDFGLGDTLTGTFSGSFQPPSFSETFIITGGTGRFMDAAGSFLGIGTVTFTPDGANTHMDFEGQVTVVPEPHTLGLLMVGLVGLIVVRRRRGAVKQGSAGS